MIIDCFPYFNEKELLELRLKMLYNHVDLFVITEGSHTHKGVKKDFTCEKIIDDLYISKEKIKIVPVYMPSYEYEKNPWVRERMQRDAAAHFISDEDVAYISDCDEIINPKYVKYYVSIVKKNPENILRVPLAFLCSRADFRVYDEKNNPVSWNSPFMCTGKHLKKYTLSQIRESRALCLNNIEYQDIFAVDNGVIEDAGWHFTWMGDFERVKTKQNHFLHWNEVDVQENYIPAEGKSDLLGRRDHMLRKYDRSKLPKEVFELENVKKFLFQENDD
jgi:beta-1,4-mannosyl-glycoprotein beta-1,4-N-acetylglucosaminyltransferase